MAGVRTTQFERRRCRLKDNIKTDLEGLASRSVDLIYFAQDNGRWRAHVIGLTKLLAANS